MVSPQARQKERERGDQEVTRKKAKRKSLVDPYRDTIAAWLEEDGEYRATLPYDRLRATGFPASSFLHNFPL